MSANHAFCSVCQSPWHGAEFHEAPSNVEKCAICGGDHPTPPLDYVAGTMSGSVVATCLRLAVASLADLRKRLADLEAWQDRVHQTTGDSRE